MNSLIIHIDDNLVEDIESGDILATIDFIEGISIDCNYELLTTDTYTIKLYIFLKSGEGDYVPLEGNFATMEDVLEYLENWTLQDLKDELE